MKHGIIEQIIQYIRGLHDDTVLFIKGGSVGGFGSIIFLWGNSPSSFHIGYEFVIKACTIGTLAFITGMATVSGKHFINFLIKKFTKKKDRKQDIFPKNNQNKKTG